MHIEMSNIYLDNNATTPLDPTVREVMLPYLKERFGNPSSQHGYGIEAGRAITDARHIVAGALGVREYEIVFTSGATESVNTAIKGIARATQRKGRHIVTSLIEHECVLETCRYLEEDGWSVTYVMPNEYGTVDAKAVTAAIREDTTLIAIMHVNNELGTIYDISEIARQIKQRDADIAVCVDGAQAFGKLRADLSHIDAYAFSAHKLHGPKGVGGLYVREGVQIKPLMSGGGQEFKLRSGTENVPGIVGLGEAAKVAYAYLDAHQKHLGDVKQAFMDEMRVFKNVHINSPVDALSTTVNFSVKGVSADALMRALEAHGIYISTGSACSANNTIKSHVLAGINASEEIQNSALRVSFSRMNTLEEAYTAAGVIKREGEALLRRYR